MVADEMMTRWDVTLAAAGIWFLLFWAAAPALIGAVWPPEYYMRITTFVVEPSRVGQPERVLSDRTVVRDHDRTIHVTVVGLEGSALGYLCDRSVAALMAKAGSLFPPDMTLRRFMGEERDTTPCRPRPVGTYSVSGYYEIDGPFRSKIKQPIPAATFEVTP
jgi:hypothetical protein